MTESPAQAASADPIQGHWERACSLAELPSGGIVHVGSGRRLAVVNRGGELFAFVDMCPHAHLPVTSGWMVDCVIVCGHHGARFDLTTGAAQAVTDEPLKMLSTKVSDGAVFVLIPPDMRF